MPLTNYHGLPSHFVAAVEHETYVGGGDISTTKLIDAPQIRALLTAHGESLPDGDVTDAIPSLLGQSVHAMLERAAKANPMIEVETRMFAEVNGWTLSGQFDVYDRERMALEDYKVTSAWKADGDVQWERQLNVLAWLARQQPNAREIRQLGVIAIFRDFTRSKIGMPGYPDAFAKYIPIPLWDSDAADAYVRSRIALHQQAMAGTHILCTDEERWATGPRYALHKRGAKRAVKLYENADEAYGAAGDNPLLYVQSRPGTFRRCESYCPVSTVCNQWLNGN